MRFTIVIFLQLEKWWEDKAYLEGRYPISPLVNFVGPAPYMLDIWPPEDGTQIERAAIGLWYNMKFWQLLRRYAASEAGS